MFCTITVGATIGAVGGAIIGKSIKKEGGKLSINLKEGYKEAKEEYGDLVPALTALLAVSVAGSVCETLEREEESLRNEIRANKERIVTFAAKHDFDARSKAYNTLAESIADMNDIKSVTIQDQDLFESKKVLTPLEMKALENIGSCEINEAAMQETNSLNNRRREAFDSNVAEMQSAELRRYRDTLTVMKYEMDAQNEEFEYLKAKYPDNKTIKICTF